MNEAPVIAPPNVQVHVEAPRSRMGWKGKFTCIVAAGALMIGAYNTVDDHLGWPALPGILGHLPGFGETETTPPVAEAQVLDDYDTEAVLKSFCAARAGAKVAVETHNHEWSGSGNFDQVVKGDMLLCGDLGGIEDRAVLVRDGTTNKVKTVTLVTDGLQVTQPRIDFMDKDNCVDIRTGDNQKTIDKKIADWDKKAAKGQATCDEKDGFSVSGAFGTENLAGVISVSYRAAQIAIAIGAEPRQQIEEQNPAFIKQLQQMLEQRYPGADVHVSLRPDEEQRIARINKVVDELKDNKFEVSVVPDEKNPKISVIVVKAPGGSVAKVRIRSVDIKGVNITDLSVGEERRLPPPTTSTTLTPQGKAA